MKKDFYKAVYSGMKPATDSFDFTMPSGETVTITVKRTLNMNEMIAMAADIVNTVIDQKTGTYMPEMLDFAERICILHAYAGIPIPKKASDAYDVVYRTDLFHEVLKHIDDYTFDVVMSGIRKKINFTADLMKTMVATRMTELLDGIGNIVNMGTQLGRNISNPEFISAMNNLSDNLAGVPTPSAESKKPDLKILPKVEPEKAKAVPDGEIATLTPQEAPVTAPKKRGRKKKTDGDEVV